MGSLREAVRERVRRCLKREVPLAATWCGAILACIVIVVRVSGCKSLLIGVLVVATIFLTVLVAVMYVLLMMVSEALEALVNRLDESER